jgi:thiosulfate/3-mercaptopyruvate sulfurtransferase
MKPQAYSMAFRRVLLALAIGVAWTSAVALEIQSPLVEPGWLAEHQGEVVILDVREDATTYLGTPAETGKKPDLKKLKGHIPGAVSVPWKKVVAKAEEQGTQLKAMLPSAEAFSALMQASGVNNDSAVVIAGRGVSSKDQAYAARLYFTLKYFGHDNVALLNGGTAQWAKEGKLLAHTPESPAKGDFVAGERREHLLATTADVTRAMSTRDLQLVDCRTEDYYLGLTYKRGFVSPDDKGHLSGAKALPFVVLSDNAGPAKLYSPEEIRDVARLKGIDLDAPTVFYCNTGVTASLGWFALHELLGNTKTRLYDGSMHAWSSLDPSHEVVTLAQAAEEAATPAEAEPPATERTRQAMLVMPPKSLQTRVDERRDALRRQRNDYFDALSGRQLFQPAWMRAREEMMDDYRDSLRAAHREHRDAMRLYTDAMRGLHAPWARHRHDWAEIRGFVSQMEQLDRQELRDRLGYGYAYLPW